MRIGPDFSGRAAADAPARVPLCGTALCYPEMIASWCVFLRWRRRAGRLALTRGANRLDARTALAYLLAVN
ncbi:hypothetical protein DC366_12145 [Pelagivirga sediminicola]|uniref:Uncharacterized protein n=1 Tax=Pelagivirga sediminicola TaxID=2170575 RepID=A0A2T7G620_9RHOB|nr:hypothetical protein DC366_12145 [Pelagivirga sediminicola]